MIPLGSKLAPSGGVISWNNSNREGRIHFVGKLTQVSDSGSSWPSCLTMFSIIPQANFNFPVAFNLLLQILSVWTSLKICCGKVLNPLPHMPILASSNSATNKI